MPKRLISEREIRQIARTGVKSISVDENTIVTPSAYEFALRQGIRLLKNGSNAPAPGLVGSGASAGGEKGAGGEVVALGSDHGGFQLKEILKKEMVGMGYSVVDVGTDSEEPCDYPDFAYAVARMVSTGEASKGIVVDGAGSGSCMVANKVPGVRAANCTNEFLARNSREHNDANVLTLGSRVVGQELAKGIVRTWLEAVFAGGRHRKRVEKIENVEERQRR